MASTPLLGDGDYAADFPNNGAMATPVRLESEQLIFALPAAAEARHEWDRELVSILLSGLRAVRLEMAT